VLCSLSSYYTTVIMEQESLTRNSIGSQEGPQNANLNIREINVFQLESFSKVHML
jgi:hypothetical protein